MPQKTFTVKSPHDGKAIGEYPLNREEQVDEAVRKARAAYGKYRRLSLKERSKLLLRGADVCVDMIDEMVDAVYKENGKKKIEVIDHEVFFSIELFHVYGKNLKKYLKPVKVKTPLHFPHRRSYYQFHPRGVVLVISPWNYPLFLSMAPMISAVAAGNAVILKPASQTPGVGELCEKIFKKAGFPKDLVQTVTGSGSVTGSLLLEHPGIDMYFFTGSTEVGKTVYEAAARGIKPVTLELGGNDPLIVLKTADLDRAASAAVFAAYSNAGQTCVGTERCYVEAPVYNEFVKKVKELTRKFETGPGQGPWTLGPMITKGQLKIVQRHLKEAEDRGAEVTFGKNKMDKDRYIAAACLTNVPADTALMTEETFGPLLPIIKVKDYKEALRLANDTKYGLSSAVFGKPGGDTRKVVDGLEAGTVAVNDVMTPASSPYFPFGGVKESGMNTYHGVEGLRSFCRVQSVLENKKHKAKREFYWYPFDQKNYGLVKEGLTFLYGHGLGKKMGGLKSAVKMYLKMV